MCTNICGDKTRLPAKGRVQDAKAPDGGFQHRNELGMIFTRSPFSSLTRAHGFNAVIESSFVPLPGICFAGPIVQSHEEDSEVFDYSRFKFLKGEMEKNAYCEKKSICCIIDWSTDISIAVESVVGNNPGTTKFIDVGDLTLGDYIIDCEKFFLGIQIVRLHIQGRPYVQTVKVVRELFPGHTGVDIDIVLGKDFLSSFPGLALQPVLSGGSLEFIPWDYGDIENGPHFYESSFNVNEKGELLVYVCGHAESKEILNSQARVLTGETEKLTNEKGAYGVFFGPNSPWNMSLLSIMNGTPVHERALIEGIIAVSDLLVDGGFIFGNPTFSSVRIFTDSEFVVNFMNSETKIAECLERQWINKNGVRLGVAEPLAYWYNSTRQGYKKTTQIPWMKKNLFIFEKVEKKRKGLQAARHLALCGLKAEFYTCNEDLGDARSSSTTIASWEGMESSDFIYINPPRLLSFCNTIMIKQKISDYIESRDQASAKAPREDRQTGSGQADFIQKALTDYFHPGNLYSFGAIILKFSTAHKYNSMEILEIFDSSFMKEILKICKEKRGLSNSLEFFKEDDGKVRFFHRKPDVTSQDHESVLLDIFMGDFSTVKNAKEFKKTESRGLGGSS